MNARLEAIFDRVSPWISIAAALISAAVPATWLAGKLQRQELFFGIIALLVAASIGISSRFIARVAKRLTRRPRIFLSYSRDNFQQASMLREALSRDGAHVWFDETDLRAGEDLRATIGAAIENSNSVIVMLSGQPGPNVKFELESALARRVPILAVLGPGVEAPQQLKGARIFHIKEAGSDFGDIAAAAMRARQ